MKRTKEEVDYSEGMKTRHCGICRFYTGIKSQLGTCSKVMGIIKPEMWCKLFEELK